MVNWRDSEVIFGASLCEITIGNLNGRLYVFDSERITLPRRGTKFVAYFGPKVETSALSQVMYCSQRIPRTRTTTECCATGKQRSVVVVPIQRPNTAVAIRQDAKLGSHGDETEMEGLRNKRTIRFADMFAGAGGLSLGFLLSNRAVYKLCAALDVSKICITTLKKNLSCLDLEEKVTGSVSSDAVRLADLGERESLEPLLSELHTGQGIDVVIGGPPCQPFSSARRGPASQAEARLLHSFCEALERLQPSVLLLENVQGILWKDASGVAPAQRFVERLSAIGYRVAARVLDAAWYGAAQHRARAFVVGLHSRVKNTVDPEDAFPEPRWIGSQMRPYRTVADAIGDLPAVPNGHRNLEVACLPRDCDEVRGNRQPIFDHITSRHSEYVLARFRQIRPGENWTAIREMMSNYTKRDRTHSNIYRRLEWDKPSVTLGHYRKSMLIHPNQDRGLSLREAMRLQSFPDWYRIWGHEECLTIGLDRKQQQLANAVPPILAKAVAERIAEIMEVG